jgi:hypothetical protein
MRTSFAIGISALLAVAAAGTLGAIAQDVEKEALANPRKFYAVIVQSNGTVIDDANLNSVVRTSAGQYTVDFEKKIEQCFPVATIYGGTSGSIRVGKVEAEPKRILVRTRSEANAFDDRGFSLLVICP